MSAQRAKLIEAGVELLERDGVQSLSARKFAAKRGTSTMAVYTHFGNIAGLLDVAAGRIRDDGSLVMAARLWTLTHGAVTLEMAGFFGNAGHGLTRDYGPRIDRAAARAHWPPRACLPNCKALTSDD